MRADTPPCPMCKATVAKITDVRTQPGAVIHLRQVRLFVVRSSSGAASHRAVARSPRRPVFHSPL
jgi:hypothetical protein